MTPDESEMITHAGTVLIQNISALIFTFGLFGAYILAFIISMHIILQKENNGWARKAMIALLLTGFGMLVLNTCATIGFDMFLVKFGLVVSLPGGLIAQEMASDMKSIAIGIVTGWSENFLFVIADTAIVWRAWVLWTENRLIRWTLPIILLADIGVNIADAIIDTKSALSSEDISVPVAFDWLSTALNLTVNTVATLLIAHRAWKHHQSIHTISVNKRTPIEAILLLMVESGAIFGMVQIINIILIAVDIHKAYLSPVDDALGFLSELYIYSAALNPVALVILIQTGNTYEYSFHLEDVTSPENDSVPNVS
ncbi:hypothetical protein BT96DRAFT_918921 [Gymnopus androsaceus JB14]|uniref:Family A G protein-coupled receptor-like protein n=1 Tax=Gymnopus androsaceus JB14 TaxID=1447944 RepID=A0A6A4HQL4_9AGAR|nr:hypothetical protein BT96DRAFT_918921 [Gymnopus androsaceus JB14]